MITFNKAVSILEVSKVTVYSYIEKKYLTPHKNDINNRVYFDEAEVKKLADALKEPLPFTEN